MYVRTQMPKHTRACLLVGFCSSSGYTLLNNVAAPGAPEFYSSDGFVATLEQGAAGGGKMFDFLSYASTHPAAPPTHNLPTPSGYPAHLPIQPALLPCPPRTPALPALPALIAGRRVAAAPLSSLPTPSVRYARGPARPPSPPAPPPAPPSPPPGAAKSTYDGSTDESCCTRR